jgi:hypothetical protein
VTLAQRAADFLAHNDSAKRRGDHGVALEMAELVGEASANISRDVGVLEEQGALEELPAMEAGPQNEMAVQECASPAEEREKIVAH